MIQISRLRCIPLLILCLVSASLSYAQQTRHGELLEQLESATSDSAKIYVNKQLGYHYQDLNQPKALTYFEHGMEAAIRAGDSLQMANLHFSMGYTYGAMEELPAALENYLEALRIYEAMDDSWRLVNTYMSLANLYLKNNDKDKQREYLDQAEHYLIREKDSVQLSELYNHRGVLFDQQGELDSARIYLEKGLDIAYDTGNSGTIGSALINLGLTLRHLGKTKEALDKFNEALPIYESEEDFYALTILHNNLGATHLQEGNYDLAQESFNRSILFSRRAGMDQGLMENYKNLAELFEKKGDYKEQAAFLTKYHSLKDSLFTVEKENQLTKLESDYVIEKKNLELETKESELQKRKAQNTTYILLFVFSLIILGLLLVYYTRTRKQNQLLVSKNELINTQKKTLEQTLDNLKATQAQLIHSEKMASLGELTAGIAHEIRNPLNFINNFSDVTRELVVEMIEEVNKGESEEAEAIGNDVIQNLEKIVTHGQRADGIVKGMLQHSQIGDGQLESVDINVLTEKFLRLSYHGYSAKDNSFNATLETEYDSSIGIINIVPQEIGRVLFNLLNNAFHAVSERMEKDAKGYEPTVWIHTRRTGEGVEISVRDNGGGIPNDIREKIFQPFFTTKPTGEGTGLGLSMSYDIITKGHGGTLEVTVEDGETSEFIINLPKV